MSFIDSIKERVAKAVDQKREVANYDTITADIPIGTELGRSGNKYFHPGYAFEEWLPALTGTRANQVWREMGDQDAYVAACLNAFRTFYRYSSWTVEPASKEEKDLEAAEFLKSCLGDMQHSWNSFISECGSVPQYGFGLFEIVYKKRDGKNDDDYRASSKFDDGLIGWQNFSPRAQNTILHYDWKEGEPNRLLGATQLSPPDYLMTFIPIEKLLLVRTESVKDSPWGRSLLRSAYRAWFMKKALEDMRVTVIERGGAGIPRAKVPAHITNYNTFDENGNIVSTDYAAKASLDSIKSMLTGLRLQKNAYVIVPQQFDDKGNPLFDIDFLVTGTSDIVQHINSTIKELEIAILVSMMCEFLGVGNGASGSMALAQVKSSNFTKAVTAHLDTIEASLNNQAVLRLFDLNSGEFKIDVLPRIVHSSVEEMPITELSALLTLFPKVGWDLSNQPEIRTALLKSLGLPNYVEVEPDESQQQIDPATGQPIPPQDPAALQQQLANQTVAPEENPTTDEVSKQSVKKSRKRSGKARKK